MRTKTRQELARDYGVDRKTLYRWLKKAKLSLSSHTTFTPKELKMIYEKLGKPDRQ